MLTSKEKAFLNELRKKYIAKVDIGQDIRFTLDGRQTEIPRIPTPKNTNIQGLF